VSVAFFSLVSSAFWRIKMYINCETPAAQLDNQEVDENVDAVNVLVLSKGSAPKRHKTISQIARETGIYHLFVCRIIIPPTSIGRGKCIMK